MRSPGLKLALLLFCGAMILAIGMGVRQSFGLYLQPISADLGWSMASLGFAVAVQQIVWGATQPLFGALADRYGAGRVVFAGALAYAAGLWVMSVHRSPLEFTLGAGVLVGLGVSGTGFAIVFGAIARATPPEWRSMALGIGSAGGSFGQFAFAPISQGLIDALGWSEALLALIAFAALIPLLGYALSGTPAKTTGEGSAGSLSEALAEAAKHRSYWLLNVGFFVCGFHVAFISTHLPGFIAACMLPPALGATALALIGLFNIIGSYAAGALGGRYRKKNLLAGIYLGRALAIGIFLAAPKTELSVLVFGAAMGALWLGTVPLTSGLVGQIYGTRYLATLFGIVFLSHQVGGFFGAWLGGAVFDLTGSYDVMWLVSIALGIIAGLVHLPVADRALRPATA
ncbi:MAG: MFS transporter [Rhodospirillales bacterium]|nr:MFS transporter [Rhodospirillales bacterium]